MREDKKHIQQPECTRADDGNDGRHHGAVHPAQCPGGDLIRPAQEMHHKGIPDAVHGIADDFCIRCKQLDQDIA